MSTIEKAINPDTLDENATKITGTVFPEDDSSSNKVELENQTKPVQPAAFVDADAHVGANRVLILREILGNNSQFAVIGLLNEHGLRNQFVEEYRMVKRPLLLNVQGKGASQVEHPNLIMITSSLPGEGKTFISTNLSMSIALERDHTVLFVDADVAKPGMSRLLGIENELGLIDVLMGDVPDIADVMFHTDIPKLSVIPAGTLHPHSTELLASNSMTVLMQEIAQRYSDRIVIFDSPPLLVTSEARVLAKLMGQILMVVEESKTSKSALKESISLISSNEIVGLVLNKDRRFFFDPSRSNYAYGSYSGGAS